MHCFGVKRCFWLLKQTENVLELTKSLKNKILLLHRLIERKWLVILPQLK